MYVCVVYLCYDTISYVEFLKYVLSVRPFFCEPAREVVSHPPWWIQSLLARAVVPLGKSRPLLLRSSYSAWDTRPPPPLLVVKPWTPRFSHFARKQRGRIRFQDLVPPGLERIIGNVEISLQRTHLVFFDLFLADMDKYLLMLTESKAAAACVSTLPASCNDSAAVSNPAPIADAMDVTEETTTTDPAAPAGVDNGVSPGSDASFTDATATGTTFPVSPTPASNSTTDAPPDDHPIASEPPVGDRISVSTPHRALSSPNHNIPTDNPVSPSQGATGRKKRRN